MAEKDEPYEHAGPDDAQGELEAANENILLGQFSHWPDDRLNAALVLATALLLRAKAWPDYDRKTSACAKAYDAISRECIHRLNTDPEYRLE